MKDKIQYGAFFTKKNPFNKFVFDDWYNSCDIQPNIKILEPFAGNCDILKHLPQFNFECFDINPLHETVIQRDTLYNFPKNYTMCITNPPFLSKVSAKKKNVKYDYDLADLYLVALDKMLKNCTYIATILPASFISNIHFKKHLTHIDIITEKTFDDTEIPIIVAYFNKKFYYPECKIYENGIFIKQINLFKILNYKNFYKSNNLKITFNCEDGNLGLFAIDNTTGGRIRFCDVSEINRIMKNSDRAITKIKVNYNITNEFINKLNHILEKYRYDTLDIALTSFKGLQNNGNHRKRLPYKIAKYIINSLKL